MSTSAATSTTTAPADTNTTPQEHQQQPPAQQQRPLFTPTSQYSSHVIQTFEATFGKHYMSAGGCETSRETALLLEPVLSRTAHPQMLEVGCGIGGAAFYFCQHHGAMVHGVDINAAGIEMAQGEFMKLQEEDPNLSLLGGTCTFQVLDVATAEFADESYDIIYSRDVLLHLNEAQKLQVFEKFQRWLKPGGMVCICDYCLGPAASTDCGTTGSKNSSNSAISPAFQKYLTTRGYHLVTPAAYQDLFVQAGFERDAVKAQDKQLWYCAMSQKELDRVTQVNRDAFLQTHSLPQLEKLAQVYQDKIAMTLRGDRSYIMLTATKKKQAPFLTQRRQAVVTAYQQLAARNYVMSCDGNISCRATDDTFLVTPSGVPVADLTADQIVWCQNNGKGAMPGELYKPSSESGLHDCIYRARPDVGAVVHSHSIFVCALACCRVPLPPAHYAVCELLQNFDFSSPTGGSTTTTAAALEDAVVKCAPYHTYGSRALSQSTLQALGKNHAVIMANHGALVVGATLDQAMYHAERLERECEIYWRCLQVNRPPQPLNLRDIQDLQTADQSYGQDHAEVVNNDGDDDKLVRGIDSLDEAPEVESLSVDSTSDESD